MCIRDRKTCLLSQQKTCLLLRQKTMSFVSTEEMYFVETQDMSCVSTGDMSFVETEDIVLFWSHFGPRSPPHCCCFLSGGPEPVCGHCRRFFEGVVTQDSWNPLLLTSFVCWVFSLLPPVIDFWQVWAAWNLASGPLSKVWRTLLTSLCQITHCAGGWHLWLTYAANFDWIRPCHHGGQ